MAPAAASPMYERKVHGAKIKLQRRGDEVFLRVEALVFKREWLVSLEDARWIRDRLFEVLC